VALRPSLPIHEYGAGLQQALRRGPRRDLRQPREIAVEPLSRALRRDDVPLQRLGGALSPPPDRGSRSVRSNAESRIPTPITMQLSATLNAGQ
jgi:hypothetical protein